MDKKFLKFLLKNTLKICLFGQTTQQTLSNFEPWKPWKYKQQGWDLTLVAYIKNVMSVFLERVLVIVSTKLKIETY